MEKIFEKLNNKKMIENLVIFLVLAIIVIIVINSLFDKNDIQEKEIVTSSNKVIENKYTTDFEKKLESILSIMNGVGEVRVMVSYENEIEKIPMADVKTTTTIVNEKDNDGGERKTEETNKEETIIYNENGSDKTPAIRQNVSPKVVGVIVVAEGAQSAIIKENLIKAVSATVDIPIHRIQVFSK